MTAASPAPRRELTPTEELALLRRRVNALEGLCAAYRTGGRPSEKTLDELEATKAVQP